jgi:CubicO group peptidase (beta-lactamase class C family)
VTPKRAARLCVMIMSSVVALSAVGAAPVAAEPADAGPTDDVIARIEAYLHRHRAENRIPGLAYAIVGRDRVVRQGAWGVDGDGATVTAQTPFLIGSVSKPFTATVVMRLVEAGRFGLDDPVHQHLPWFRLADQPAAARITVRHLLEHTSGLPRWASRTDRSDNTTDGLARSVRDLATVRPGTAPGTAHRYSDANYMVLGALIETVTGQPFGTALRRQVLDPLDMRHTAATHVEADQVGLPAGHRYWFDRPRRFDAPYDTSGAPYGYLATSLTDLTHFAMAHLNGGRYAGAQLLSTDGAAQMHTGQAGTANGGRYGLGWRDTELTGTNLRVVWHAGAAPGYFAHLVLIPDSGLGVIVLANSYSLALDGALAAAAFNTAQLLHGNDVRTATTDATLTWARTGLVAVVALLTAAVVRSLIHAVRPRRRTPHGRVRIGAVALAWVAGCTALAILAATVLPATMGGNLDQALLWAPDIGWTIVAVVALTGTLAAARIGVAARALMATRR